MKYFIAGPAFIIFFTFIVSCSSSVDDSILNVSLTHEVQGNKLYIKGESNLPEGAMLGVDLSGEDSYSSQSYKIQVKGDGSFVSAGFTNRGALLSGKYSAKLISYFNKNWQSEGIIKKLKSYSGAGIVDGRKIVIPYDFSVGSGANTLEKKQKVKDKLFGKMVSKFCYALQASMLCDNLHIRIDTEGKINALVGESFRGPGSIYNSDCMEGLVLAMEDESDGLCVKAWNEYGCFGTDTPRLIQENPFRKGSVTLCEYRAG